MPARVHIDVHATPGEDLAAALGPLLEAEPDLPYANFAPLAPPKGRPGAAERLHRARWLDPADCIEVLVARSPGGEPLAALRLERREFESRHFGLAMARAERPLAVRDGAPRLAALRALYTEAFQRLRRAGFAHVALRASTRDRWAPWALQELGAVHVDTQVSWMCPLTGQPHDDQLPPGLAHELHDRASVSRLPPSSWKRLAEWSGRAFDRGPLVFDLTLPADRASTVYEAWTEHVMRGEWADAVLVVRHQEEIVAFISMLELPDVSAEAGERVCGRGLGATLPEYRGLFTAIQREMIFRRPLGAAFMENETQVATIGSINVYAKLGFRFLRSTATFHRRLDGAGAAPAETAPCA